MRESVMHNSCRVAALMMFVLILSFDTAGAFQEKFQKRFDLFDGLSRGQKYNASETSDGGVVLAVTTQQGLWLTVMKTDRCGNPEGQWAYSVINEPSVGFSDAPVIIMEEVGFGFVIAGTIVNRGTACSYPYIMKIDYGGAIGWIKRFGTGVT